MGIKADDDELKQFSKPINLYKVKADSFRASWGFPIVQSVNFSVAFNTVEVNYEGDNAPSDIGSHNKAVFGLRKSKNMSGGNFMSMGALFGIGLSDVADRVATLAQKRYGYSLNLNYESGGQWTGSDYSISKLYAMAAGQVEFKSRNSLSAFISAAKAFESPFYDKIRSEEVVSRGKYLRDFKGDNAIGAGTSFNWHLIKNKTGILTFAPFIETSFIFNESAYKEQAGIGAGFSYRLWRIPFPLGLNYTQNISDGSYTISFLFGGGF
jgi:hypothetical protein